MSDTPWLTLIGIHEDGLTSLIPEAIEKLAQAEVILAPSRHLSHLKEKDYASTAEIIAWPVPYQDGIKILLNNRGRKVVVLASGDPFHYGAGTVITAHLERSEWCCFPALSCFSLMASALGWPLETSLQFGLHAKPIEKLNLALHENLRLLILLRDGQAVTQLGQYLCDKGFNASRCYVFSQMHSHANTPQYCTAEALVQQPADAPVCVAVELVGERPGISQATGKPDNLFMHHGQITKQAVRAVTLASLSPRPTQHLVDIGAGSGSISVEWMLSHPQMRATSIENNPDRIELIKQNAAQFGCSEMRIIHADIHTMLAEIPLADAYFIGGGLSAALIEAVWSTMRPTSRLVANAVTAESEALILHYHRLYGGEVLKLEISDLVPLGQKHGWKARYPITHWVIQKEQG